MRFVEAESSYRELEARLVRGELAEEEFLAQVALLRLTDGEGRRWMISGRTGRWLVHDGQQWVFADPPLEETQTKGEVGVTQPLKAADMAPAPVVKPDIPEPLEVAGETTKAAAPIHPVEALDAEVPVAAPESGIRERHKPRLAVPRFLIVGIVALAVVGCLIGGGVSAWVLFLRDWVEATPAPTSPAAVALVETYTPRPSTPTFTPTATPTPSRTPTPTITPIPSDTPIATPTSELAPPTASHTPTTEAAAPPAAAPSAVSTYQTYVVKPGETLSEIAARFGVSVQALAEANGITNPALIRAGHVLTIPSPGTTPTTLTATPTWTPIVLSTSTAMPTETSMAMPTEAPTATPTPSPTASGPKPTPKPTIPPTPKPAALSGKIAFAVWNPSLAKYELFVSSIDGSGRNMIGQGFRQPQFRPDGNMLVANGQEAQYLEHLVQMNAGGGGKVEISEHTEDSYPTWRPDGTSVAYSSSSWRDGKIRLGIVYDPEHKQQKWIPFGNMEIQGEYPFWMADGRIVYHGCEFWSEGGNCGLYSVVDSGGTPSRLTTHQSDTAPAGFGQRVAFMSARDGNWEVYVVNMDGSGLKRLTDNNAQDGLPTWSPDGQSIAFVSNRDGAWAIWVMDANGNNQRKLFDLGGGYGSGDNDWTTERISWAP